MVATIAQIIGKINPKKYAENASELIKKYGSLGKIPAEKIKEKPLSEHTFIYDSATETLEPIYFFILDLMNDFGLQTEKIIDNFSSSPGSGHFAELGQRATIMQQQGTKLLGDVNTVLRSVLNIIYDLKEFRIRLSHYDHLTTANKDAAILALKQIWLDKVDFNKGNSSIKAMALGQAGFQTLLDAFLIVKEVKDVDKIDLNDRVKRIIRPRILEFNDWLEHSETELRKRYQLERDYLKSQVNSLKLYSRWAKPYLLAAGDLEMKPGGREPALVKAFNTIILELTLLGKKKIEVKEESLGGNLPSELSKMKMKRDYYSCVLIDFKFRGIPQRVQQQQHYAFGGRADISFKSYVLNDDELKKLEEELGSSDIDDILNLVEGITTGSLSQLQEDIEFFLEEKDNESKEDSSDSGSTNPFKALFGGYNKKPEPKKGPEEKKAKVVIAKENFIEKEHIRPLAEEGAKEKAFDLFDVYKKAHGMASYT
jgi:hypothetical protein